LSKIYTLVPSFVIENISKYGSCKTIFMVALFNYVAGNILSSDEDKDIFIGSSASNNSV